MTHVEPTQSPFTESNRRPSPYHGDALPTELKGQRRRTIHRGTLVREIGWRRLLLPFHRRLRRGLRALRVAADNRRAVDPRRAARRPTGRPPGPRRRAARG